MGLDGERALESRAGPTGESGDWDPLIALVMLKLPISARHCPGDIHRRIRRPALATTEFAS